MSNFEFKRSGKKCSESGKEFAEGEEFVSALIEDGDALLRLDFSTEAWKEPPSNCLAWWKSTVPIVEKGQVYWAPREVLFAYFEHVLAQPHRADVCYVMALLLVRKRMLRLEDSIETEQGEAILVRDTMRKKNFEVNVVELTVQQTSEIQSELADKLFTDHRQTEIESSEVETNDGEAEDA